MDQSKTFSSGRDSVGDTWYVDNYVLLKEYYDMTISRIAARCVRSGNIALEEYKHYSYILDVLEEISETGEYIVSRPDLYSYVDKKISGGINALKKNLQEFKTELQHNASPDMIKQDKNELNKMKEALGQIDKTEDPTAGAGMSMDAVINKLMQQNNIKPNFTEEERNNAVPEIKRQQTNPQVSTTNPNLKPNPQMQAQGQQRSNPSPQAQNRPQPVHQQVPNSQLKPQG
ncbi:MAG: hypothetical protein E7020_06650 [Alphaproteobacteria bacterium]|nr:hypothetical protein [Alphaproteobacteria bacterium]